MDNEARGDRVAMILKAFKAVPGLCRGFWAYLVRREERRQAVEIHHTNRLRDVEMENARNDGTRAIIEALARGGEVVEVEPGGRSRMVRMPVRPAETVYPVRSERTDQRRLDGSGGNGELTT